VEALKGGFGKGKPDKREFQNLDFKGSLSGARETIGLTRWGRAPDRGTNGGKKIKIYINAVFGFERKAEGGVGITPWFCKEQEAIHRLWKDLR